MFQVGVGLRGVAKQADVADAPEEDARACRVPGERLGFDVSACQATAYASEAACLECRAGETCYRGRYAAPSWPPRASWSWQLAFPQRARRPQTAARPSPLSATSSTKSTSFARKHRQCRMRANIGCAVGTWIRSCAYTPARWCHSPLGMMGSHSGVWMPREGKASRSRAEAISRCVGESPCAPATAHRDVAL